MDSIRREQEEEHLLMEDRCSAANKISKTIPTDAAVVRSPPPPPPPPRGFRFSEYVYVGSVGIAIASAIFLVWTCVPNYLLQSVGRGIHHYTSRDWAVPMPNYAVVVTIIVAIGIYMVGINFMATPPPPTLKSMFDECSEELLGITPCKDDYQLIDHLSDIDIQ